MKEWEKKVLVLLINIIILAPLAIITLTNPHTFEPSSSVPEISTDEEDNAHIHFISFIRSGEEPYNIAYVKVGSNGKIKDGPKFVDDYTIEYPKSDASEMNITDRYNNTHYFRFNLDLPDPENFRSYRSDNASIYYSKKDKDGIVLIDNITIAHHPKETGPSVAYGPAIFGLKLELDSQDNIHIVWFINTGEGNYYEVYYMKIDNNGNILVPQMRLYVFDNVKLALFLLIFIGVPIVTVVIYIILSKRIPFTSNNNKGNNEQI